MVELERNERDPLLGCGETCLGSQDIWRDVDLEIADGVESARTSLAHTNLPPML